MNIEMTSKSRNPLSKALSILKWMLEAELDSIGVREAASALDMTPSAAHRSITALVEEDFLQRSPDGSRYAMGLELYRLIHQAAERFPLRVIALPAMERLRDACGEAVFLNLFDATRREIIGVLAVESMQTLRYVVELQKWKPLHVGASGLAILAFLSEAERRAIYADTGLRALTAASVTDPETMETVLADIRRAGYALTKGQRIEGAVGLAAPIYGPGGRMLGSLGISIPEQRYADGMEEGFSSQLIATALEIGALAGAARG